jgi:hypothetical protein
MPQQARSLARLAGYEQAAGTPEVALLRSGHFAWVMAIFAEYLTDGPVPAPEFHEYVDLEIRDLRANGVDIPDGKAREHCNGWVRKRLLNRALNGDSEEYSLTAASLDALAFTDRLIHRRSTASESRLKQIIDAVARLATDANPDPTARVRRLDEEIARLTGERLAWEGTAHAPVPPYELREQLDGITDLIRHLPSDFKRVSDSVYEMHKRFIAETSERGMSRGDMLREFFAEHDLLTASDEGRAFAGLMALLSNTREQAALRRDLTDLLQQDFAATLTREERALLRDLLRNLVGHCQAVQDTYRRLTQSLERYVDNHVEDDGLLSQRLAAAHAAAASAFAARGGTYHIPFQLGGTPLDIDSITRVQILDPRLSEAPPALADSDTDILGGLTLDELRERGGPRLGELTAAVNSALAAQASGQVSAGEVFASLTSDLRRPKSVVGLLHLAAEHGAVFIPDQTETVTAIRRDGTIRGHTFPLTIFTAPLPDYATTRTS